MSATQPSSEVTNLNQSQMFFVLLRFVVVVVFLFSIISLVFSPPFPCRCHCFCFFRSVSEVAVSHIDTPTHFFIQYNQNWKQIEALGNKLNTFFQVRFLLTCSWNSWVFTWKCFFFLWRGNLL